MGGWGVGVVGGWEIWGLGDRGIMGWEFGVGGLGVWGLEDRIPGFGFRVLPDGFRISGLGFRG